VNRPLALAFGALLFTVLATANSGGYRYGVSDQAFYEPAVAMSLHPDLFPRDRVVLASQMRLWIGDSVLAWTARLVGGDLPTLFAVVYVVTLLALFAAAIVFGRSLGASWWTITTFLILLTIRHRIPKTGANSLEGYMHPRILAFALGLGAFAAIVRNRIGLAALLVAVAAAVHTTVAIWFGAVLVIAVAWRLGTTRAIALLLSSAAAVAILLITITPLQGRLAIMDPAWVSVLGDKDYLFASEWPAYAWILNLSYPVVLLALYWRRRALGKATSGEAALVAGLVGLVLIFLVSVPLSAARVALAVQLQVNRVFWVLDVAVTFYLAWWLMDELAGRWGLNARRGVVAALVAISAIRGVYVVAAEGRRELVKIGLPATAWTDAMSWLRTQPATWHVFADPFHAVLFGPSVRVAAERDTLLEVNKDAALAMYDREIALRLGEREHAVGDFLAMSLTDVRRLARTFGLDVFVDRKTRQFDLPVLYQNDEFVIYDLR